MILSIEAKENLRNILQKEIGLDRTSDFSDEDLGRIGLLLLTILAENLKMKVKNA